MPKALCQSYNVNPANQPKLGVQMNSLTLHGALMVPKCLLCKSRPKGILPLTTFHKVKRLFLGTPFTFWGKSNLTDLRLHYRWTTGHCKRTLACDLSPAFVLLWKDCHGELGIISTTGRRKKGWIWGDLQWGRVLSAVLFLNESTCKSG